MKGICHEWFTDQALISAANESESCSQRDNVKRKGISSLDRSVDGNLVATPLTH